ncbi:hypothetical protein KD5_18980 [Yersinia pseudotuberculosis]|nr:hypothetical protein YP72344_18280 [Yersinia pseudotuberculosis]BET62502.1 hypothetical protein YPSE1_19610 [Yersinia pseudotuberculosis]
MVSNAMQIKKGDANIKRIPVANIGGIVSTAILIANHVVPQVKETNINSIDIMTLRINPPLQTKPIYIFNMRKIFSYACIFYGLGELFSLLTRV